MLNNINIMNNHRRRRRLRRKLSINQHIINSIYALFIVVLISSMLAVVITTVHHEITSYKLAVENITKYDDMVGGLVSQIGDLKKEEEALALKLYISIHDCVKRTGDSASIRLYERAVAETPEAFQSDTSDSMISILAFLDRYEDVKYDVNVAQALYDLEVTQDYRNRVITSYNDAVETYNFWVLEYEDTFAYRHLQSKRITIKEFKKYAIKTEL